MFRLWYPGHGENIHPGRAMALQCSGTGRHRGLGVEYIVYQNHVNALKSSPIGLSHGKGTLYIARAPARLRQPWLGVARQRCSRLG
jgi:hypothetical protein